VKQALGQRALRLTAARSTTVGGCAIATGVVISTGVVIATEGRNRVPGGFRSLPAVELPGNSS